MVSAVAGPSGRSGALGNLRVCDLSGQLAGAGATRFLAAFGAEVIRVEDPVTEGAWDLVRVSGPFPGGIPGRDRSTPFNNHNAGKLGVTINLRDERGRSLLRELVTVSDVVTENFSAGVFTRMGFPYETLRELRPDVIYVSNCGFGASGPYSKYRTWGPIVQAFCGLTNLSRLPGGQPAGWGYSYMDHMGASYMAMAILAALVHRDRTGEGQWIDMSCVEAGTTLLGPLLLDSTVNHRRTEDDPLWSSNRAHSPAMAPHGIYPASEPDRWVAVACRDDDQWRRLAALIAEPWAAEPSLDSGADRQADQDRLDDRMASWTRRFPVADLDRMLRSAQVTSSVVASPEERIDGDPMSSEWNLFPTVHHSELGEIRVDGVPVHLSETDWAISKGAACLGEDNALVLGELLGHSPDELEALAKAGVI
jgi:crotonobetainyl-CoA:carnitine CoA-transferase CaiB-like acyl-CoA transferase